MMLRRACIAVKSLLATVIGSRRVVPVSVRTVCGPQAVKVYNLTLESENVYYANGVLVENCADALCLTFAEPAAEVSAKVLEARAKMQRKSRDADPFRGLRSGK